MENDSNNINGFVGGVFTDNNIYSSELNMGPTAGSEKNTDSMDEKTTENKIEVIPQSNFIARMKASKVYYEYLDGYNVRKKEIIKDLRKLEKIENKLKKYEHYPDDTFGRDKLVKQKAELEVDLSKHRKRIEEVIKPKLRIYGKALGMPRKDDEFFNITLDDSTFSRLKKRVEEMYNSKKDDSITNEVIKAKNAQEEVKNVHNEKLRAIYDKYVSEYGEEMVNKYWDSIIEKVMQEKLQQEVNNMDLNDMLNESDENKTNNNVK